GRGPPSIDTRRGGRHHRGDGGRRSSHSGTGGLQLGPKLFLFGGVATVVVIALVGLTRREGSSGRGFLAGAVSVLVAHLDRLAARDCQPPRRRDSPTPNK